MCKGSLQERRITERNRTRVCLVKAVEPYNIPHRGDFCEAQVGGLLQACIPLERPRTAELY